MLKVFFFTICLVIGAHAALLETSTDSELQKLILTEKYVVVLFAKDDCEECDKIERELVLLREDLVDSLSAWVVKAVNSELLQRYSISGEPALIFFRHTIPLLYDGPINDEEILTTFIENKEPLVRELTDDNFEHLTQASSGATTGDWFVMFYSLNHADSLRMTARWEAVAAKLHRRLNVARIDKYSSGALTARRFGVYEIPTFIFFRQGRMYRYEIPKYDVNSFASFAKEWYRNARAEKVPVPQSPFDDFTQMCADYIRENVWLMKLGSMSIGILVIISVVSRLRRKAEEPQKKEK